MPGRVQVKISSASRRITGQGRPSDGAMGGWRARLPRAHSILALPAGYLREELHNPTLTRKFLLLENAESQATNDMTDQTAYSHFKNLRDDRAFQLRLEHGDPVAWRNWTKARNDAFPPQDSKAAANG